MVDLSVDLKFLKLKNPILTASGTFGYGIEFLPFYDLSILGGVIVKGLFLNEKKGNPPPRLSETPSGLLNSIGLQGIGVKRFYEEVFPELKKFNTEILINVCGDIDEEYAEVVDFFKKEERISGFELNISCPNIKKDGMCPAMEPDWTYRVVKIVREVTEKPIITKLSPNAGDIKSVAISAEEAGSDGISLINTILGMAVDWKEKKSRLGSLFGGLSGPAIKPVALRMVYQVINAVQIPVIGIGGIFSGEDVMEFLCVGAKAVEIGTANLVDPYACKRIIDELKEICERNSVERIENFIGSFKSERID
ncbi:MAG: dihydroorotate dehydrogenase [Acidobacteriota bacterium]